jgi:hypothetical protein
MSILADQNKTKNCFFILLYQIIICCPPRYREQYVIETEPSSERNRLEVTLQISDDLVQKIEIKAARLLLSRNKMESHNFSQTQYRY